MFELAALVLALSSDVYVDPAPKAPQPRFDLPDVYYKGSDLHIGFTGAADFAAFRLWKSLVVTSPRIPLHASSTDHTIPFAVLKDLPLGHQKLECLQYSNAGTETLWTGWLTAESFITCQGDVTLDLLVDVNDLTVILAEWGGPGGDMNYDGATDIDDLLITLASWGACD